MEVRTDRRRERGSDREGERLERKIKSLRNSYSKKLGGQQVNT